MRSLLFGLAICCLAQPAAAQLTTTYTGTQTVNGTSSPATAQFSVENGRAVMIMKGANGGRLIFDDKAQVLHIISDDRKSYIDIDKSTAGGGDPMAAMQAQLANLPPDQRAMAEQMLKSKLGTPPPPLVYNKGTETKTIAGYSCTMFEGMRGSEKVTEYCGTTSGDFKMSDVERKTMLDMQSYLRNFTIMVRSADDSSRAFQWDTSVDGYPVATRCFVNGTMTLDLTLDSVNRKPIPAELYTVPKDYKKMDLQSMMGGRGRGGR